MKNMLTFIKPTLIVIALLSPLVFNTNTTMANHEVSTCKIVCPNSGVYCVHQDDEGTTWSEKGESDAAVTTGPCKEVGISN